MPYATKEGTQRAETLEWLEELKTRAKHLGFTPQQAQELRDELGIPRATKECTDGELSLFCLQVYQILEEMELAQDLLPDPLPKPDPVEWQGLADDRCYLCPSCLKSFVLPGLDAMKCQAHGWIPRHEFDPRYKAVRPRYKEQEV